MNEPINEPTYPPTGPCVLLTLWNHAGTQDSQHLCREEGILSVGVLSPNKGSLESPLCSILEHTVPFGVPSLQAARGWVMWVFSMQSRKRFHCVFYSLHRFACLSQGPQIPTALCKINEIKWGHWWQIYILIKTSWSCSLFPGVRGIPSTASPPNPGHHYSLQEGSRNGHALTSQVITKL